MLFNMTTSKNNIYACRVTVISSTHHQVAGRLHIELSRVAGLMPDHSADDLSSESSADSRHESFMEEEADGNSVAVGSTIVCRVRTAGYIECIKHTWVAWKHFARRAEI